MTEGADGADVVVIGGGLVGTATAYEAAVAGASTVLVDRADPGRATDAGAGILSPETSGFSDQQWFDFAMASAEHYRALVARLEAAGIDDHGYSPSGLLCLTLHEHEAPWFDERAELASARASAVVHEISPADARALFPPLGEVHRVLHSSAAARVDGRRMASALARAGEAAGVRRLAANVTGLTLRGGQAVGVETSFGPVPCGAVIIAGGAWSPQFGAALRVDLPVAPMKGQIVHLQLPGAPDSGQWPIVQPVLNFYLVPWPGGRVACGGTMESEAGFDVRPTAAGVHQLLREALRIAPGLADASFTEVRVGLRPAAEDDLPILGAVPGWSNVFVATGHGAEGLLLGPYSGRLVAALACQGTDAGAQPDVGALSATLAPFSPARFTD